MKNETRIEVVAVIAGAMALGGWFGFQKLMHRSATAKVAPQARVQAQNVTTSTTLRARVQPARPQTAVHAQVGLDLPETPTTTTTAPAADTQAAPGTVAPAQDVTAPAAPAGTMDQARKLLADGKKVEARAMLTEMILLAAEGTTRDEMRVMLDKINSELFFSKSASPDCAMYTVQSGDTLSAIATRQKKDVYFSNVIMLVNGISSAKKIRAGQTIKIPQGSFSALVQKHSHRLVMLLNGQYIKEYAVTVGAPATPTPEGAFVVDNNKQVNPDWYAPDGNVYKFGDPRDVLGTRWIGLVATQEHQGYGIHGTTDPESIGKDASNGCVRLLNTDVEEIFGMLQPGDKVTIVK